MTSISSFLNKLRILLGRKKFSQELDEEMEFHRAQAEQQFRADGMTSEAAGYAAKRQFGNATRLKEESREMVGFQVETSLQDFRYATRQLRKNPGFASTAILILALGIGASAAIFSAVNPILFQPLPYPHASRIMMIWYSGPDSSRIAGTFGTYREVVQRSRSFDAIAVMKPWQPTMTGQAEPERFEGQRVSSSYFQVLGVSPSLGRDFQGSDDRPNGPNAVIISDVLWRRRFGGDNTIVGRQVAFDGNIFTIIGVMPRSFENVLAPSAEVWSPLQYDMSLGSAWGHHLLMVGRLGAGVGTDPARRELDAIAHTPAPEFARPPWASLRQGFVVNSLQDDVTGGVKRALLTVLGAVMLVMAMACVNVMNLLLARGAQRSGEFAMRVALGAGRMRLVRQLLTESLVLALIGGALGTVVAEFGIRALVALSPPGLPRAGAIHLDTAVFAFATGITILIGLVVGLVPALHVSRNNLQAGMRKGSAQMAGSHQLTRRTLVITEVALALVLLVSAGLLLRSLQHLFAIDPGFDASRLLTMQVQTAGQKSDKDTTERFFTQALEKVQLVPGVAAAGFTSQLPLSGDRDEYGARFEGDDPNLGYPVFRYAVSPGYFEAIGIPLRRGRLLDAHDAGGAPPAVLVSESLARRKFPDQDPIGRRVHIGPVDRPWYTIVGVVGDVKQLSLAVYQPDAVYITTSQSWFVDHALSLVVRVRRDANALTPAIKTAIWSVDKDQPIVRVATMGQLVAATAAERRFTLTLLGAFGLVALVLVTSGIYGVLSGSVTERAREIGVRAALGASRGNIVTLVVRQGMTLTGLGVVIGLSGAVAATHAITTLLFGISRLDPLTYLGVIVLLLGVSGIACWVPAWRAARVDPSITLRAE